MFITQHQAQQLFVLVITAQIRGVGDKTDAQSVFEWYETRAELVKEIQKANEDNTATFKGRLKTELKRNKLKQKELAQITGITEAAISRYTKGDRLPQAKTLSLIAKALNVTTDYLLGGDKQ